MKEKECIQCGIKFVPIARGPKYFAMAKFCSNKCCTTHRIGKSSSLKGRPSPMKGIPLSVETRRKLSESLKGRKSWNIGKKGEYSIKRTEESAKSFFDKTSGENNWKWKGDDVSYRNLHRWVERRLGKPNECEFCNRVGTGHEIHWANKSRNYQRNVTDWLRLCTKCHGAYDRKESIII